MKLASIVIPVYNTEPYLRRCLDSILNQTYKNLQVILVDNNSSDNSLEICQSYAQQHSIFEVYQQKKQGASAARNMGLQHIKGEYLFFVDSDDYILPEYIEHFINDGDAPFIGGGYCENPIDGWRLQFDNVHVSMSDYCTDCKEWFHRIPSVHIHGNRYISSIVQTHHIQFNEDSRCGEDLRFNIAYFKCIDRLCSVDRCEYVYCIRTDSSLHQFMPDRLREEREECQEREQLLGNSKDFNSIRYIHWSIALDHYYQYLQNPQYCTAAKRCLRQSVWDSYFRKCIPYALKHGTKDMKIAVICMAVGSYTLYRWLLRCILKSNKRNA